jgi:hypothetical protein
MEERTRSLCKREPQKDCKEIDRDANKEGHKKTVEGRRKKTIEANEEKVN